MILKWFSSRTVRDAVSMRKHVRKHLNHQRDILPAPAIEGINLAMAGLTAALEAGADKPALLAQMENLEGTANKHLKPYPHSAWRENIEVLLVALAVAMGIRTFFLQPFKIPTGSMQPTLYGVTHTNLKEEPRQIPTGLQRMGEWFKGVSYVHVVAETDGELVGVGRPLRFLIFNIRQTLRVGNKTYTIWFPPDYGAKSLPEMADLKYGQPFKKGEDIVKIRVVAGDHLFVDRLTYNFRTPDRGEIIVFETRGIPEDKRYDFRIPGDQFYIKRLIGLGGETIKIGKDRHVIINGKRLHASMPHFEHVYSFDPNSEPQDSVYSGHVGWPGLAPFFSQDPAGVQIPQNEFIAMGDNTINSLDSRAWGTFPASFVIGKAFFVYWPLTERFGWGYNR